MPHVKSINSVRSISSTTMGSQRSTKRRNSLDPFGFNSKNSTTPSAAIDVKTKNPKRGSLGWKATWRNPQIAFFNWAGHYFERDTCPSNPWSYPKLSQWTCSACNFRLLCGFWATWVTLEMVVCSTCSETASEWVLIPVLIYLQEASNLS